MALMRGQKTEMPGYIVVIFLLLRILHANFGAQWPQLIMPDGEAIIINQVMMVDVLKLHCEMSVDVEES